MRVCTVCGESKSEHDYFYRNKRAEKLHSQCKNCYVIKRRKIWREHYHKYGSQYRERAVERNRRLKIKLKKLLLEYLSDKACINCGIEDPRVFEFHHIDSSMKSFGIARAIGDVRSWENILAEIKKCEILCANCHKIKTAEEKGWYKHIGLAQS